MGCKVYSEIEYVRGVFVTLNAQIIGCPHLLVRRPVDAPCQGKSPSYREVFFFMKFTLICC